MTNGWDTLQITTNPAFTDEIQMAAAGYFEGYLYALLIMHELRWLTVQAGGSHLLGVLELCVPNVAEQDRPGRTRENNVTDKPLMSLFRLTGATSK